MTSCGNVPSLAERRIAHFRKQKYVRASWSDVVRLVYCNFRALRGVVFIVFPTTTSCRVSLCRLLRWYNIIILLIRLTSSYHELFAVDVIVCFFVDYLPNAFTCLAIYFVYNRCTRILKCNCTLERHRGSTTKNSEGVIQLVTLNKDYTGRSLYGYNF